MLFVHGLWMNGAESFVLKRRLAAQGWRLRVFPWSSQTESMERVARRCARHALDIARGTLQPVHLVGHSLGGIVIYHVFETGLLAPDRFTGDFCRVVFMGTPICGSQTARVLAGMGTLGRLLGEAGAEDLTHGLPAKWPFSPQLGVIAGTAPHGLGRLLSSFDGPNDGTVSVAETWIAGATDHCELPVSHSGMWMSLEVAKQVACFLDSGRFTPD